WEKWLRTWEKEDERHKGEAELIVVTILLCGERHVSQDIFSHAPTICLLEMTNQICHRLAHLRRHNTTAHGTSNDDKKIAELDEDMQKVTKLVLSSSSDGVDSWMKQTCLAIIRTSYYAAYCSLQEIDHHISKVLFQKVD
ncbi:hypothetical protein KSS87_012211, partial [Heliosperma pusillum]